MLEKNINRDLPPVVFKSRALKDSKFDLEGL